MRSLVPLLFLAGCVTEPPTGATASQVGTTPTAPTNPLPANCPWWGCGSNSPLIDAWSFHELSVEGLPNSAGISLVGLVKDDRWYQPKVIGAQLYADSLDPAAYPPISGSLLVGSALVLETERGRYTIDIMAVNDVTPYWVGPAKTNETYVLHYTGGGDDDVPLCRNPPSDGRVWPDAVGALLFTGDRYDAQTKVVTATSGEGTAGWFNIACAGSALAKLHLNRHTDAGATLGFETTRAQRQAMLKMFASDVCGTGMAFTHPGEPLHWQNATGWVTLDGKERSIEALWDEHGALCLDEHRLEADPGYPTIRAEIAKECEKAGRALPPCEEAGYPRKWREGIAYLLSANP